MNQQATTNAKGGMVLFELMLALFIFVTVAFALVMALDAAMTAARQRNEIAAAIGGLKNQITLLHRVALTPCDTDLPDDGSGIAYHLVIEPEQLRDQKGQPVPNVLRATVTAKWKSYCQLLDRELSQLIYQP